MTVQVGNVQLHDNLWWANEFETPSVAMSDRRTIGGRLVIQVDPTVGGREIKLSTEGPNSSNVAYFTRGQVLALRAIESDGAPVTLTYNNDSLEVIIKPGGLEVEPLGAKRTYGIFDYYVGTLNLLET